MRKTLDMAADSFGTEDLLQRANLAERSALSVLLDRHRGRLRKLVANRLDQRIAARVDPSDIVQETLADAARRLPEYLRDRPMPYWAWLQRLALQRLVWCRRFHLVSMKRSVARDRPIDQFPFDGPTVPFTDQLIASGTSPSEHVIREQEGAWITQALESLAATDRQVLELRYVEDLPFSEIATNLNLSLSAVKMRHLRALERLRSLRIGSLREPDG